MNTAKKRYKERKKYGKKQERQEVQNVTWMKGKRTEGQKEKQSKLNGTKQTRWIMQQNYKHTL
jgi:hypothetical protein